MDDQTLPTILWVDDETRLLEGMSRALRRRYNIRTASSGAEGLELLTHDGPFDILVTDFRMPGMNGVTFLAKAREQAPETVRVLLTGYADAAIAMSAVNEGNVFRMLNKPCSPEALLAALADAIEQHQLITAEQTTLRETLLGSVKALCDVLALSDPGAFGRSSRAKEWMLGFAAKLEIAETWPLEVAAMLSQIACMSLPAVTAKKLFEGLLLSPEEQAMVDGLPALGEEILANIPRMEPVREILRYQDKRYDGQGPPRGGASGADLPIGARMLKIILDYDALVSQGAGMEPALATMASRLGWYDRRLQLAFESYCKETRLDPGVAELPLEELSSGMMFAADVRTVEGMFLVARGQEVTPVLAARLQHLQKAHQILGPFKIRAGRESQARTLSGTS